MNPNFAPPTVEKSSALDWFKSLISRDPVKSGLKSRDSNLRMTTLEGIAAGAPPMRAAYLPGCLKALAQDRVVGQRAADRGIEDFHSDTLSRTRHLAAQLILSLGDQGEISLLNLIRQVRGEKMFSIAEGLALAHEARPIGLEFLIRIRDAANCNKSSGSHFSCPDNVRSWARAAIKEVELRSNLAETSQAILAGAEVVTAPLIDTPENRASFAAELVDGLLNSKTYWRKSTLEATANGLSDNPVARIRYMLENAFTDFDFNAATLQEILDLCVSENSGAQILRSPENGLR